MDAVRIPHGRKIADVSGVIIRKTDQKPGPLPEIRPIADAIVYALDIASQHAQLIIRCDGNGNVTAQIATCPRQQ
jgi:hypothetical protein